MRSQQLTLPGFTHDVCSAIHPLAFGSPFFRTLPLDRFGLEWVHSSAPLAHPFDDGTAVLLERSVDDTLAHLDLSDRRAYRDLMQPIVDVWQDLSRVLLAPLAPMRHPLLLARFGMHAMRSIDGLNRRFRGERARTLFAGMAGHSMLPLDTMPSASVALVLAAAGHDGGWPFPRGGTQSLADALANYLKSLGGEIILNTRVTSLDELPAARAVLCDITPRQFLQIAADRLPPRYARLLRQYRYNRMGAFKVDWALSAPVPWRARETARAATVHLGASTAEIAASERAAWNGQVSERPYMIMAQHTLSDPTRAPAGQHTLWGYCHVPFASEHDMLGRMEAQVERFAPGFRHCILARKVSPPRALEAHNSNIVGGDINGGLQDLWQVFIRPTLNHYVTALPNVFLCSSSTPPGGGVHGMCGFAAANVALHRCFR